jgi:hypothetical protein
VHQAETWQRRKQPFHCILPVVIYNGRRPWAKARSRHQIFQVPEECGAMFSQFQVSDAELDPLSIEELKSLVADLERQRLAQN